MNRATASGRDHGPLPALLLLLTVSTGMIDAVSFLGLGGVFAAAMSGNVILFGIGIAGGGTLLSAALSLTAYSVGAACGGRMFLRGDPHRGILLAGGTAIHAALVFTAALIGLRYGLSSTPLNRLILGMLAFSMGWQYSIIRRLKVPDLTTTVVTTTLTGLFGESTGYDKQHRRIMMIGMLLLGALTGGLLWRLELRTAPMWVAGAILTGCAAAAYVAARRPGSQSWS
ncbi:YoaK family protein [Nonomuraea sp. MCN248]|uniref:YoaK family protein n=1 Tax=Nonomuraea corallina TaxID=2989783 RepID=A0ABT4SKA6_9ACTN|nr:YoaK family protein [Nonomuraea corallina]MDA0637458.1 YoaK family protein [Nonomuraea corallina]